jgi:hypothetical protein
MTHVDPATRLAHVRAELARQGARMPRTDHNGRVTPPPMPATPALTPATPAAVRAPAPNPAQGAASADPVGDMIRDMRAAGRWAHADLIRRELGA